MPPKYVTNIRQLIFWEYAKLIAESAGMPDHYGFIVSRYKALESGKMKMSDLMHDYKNERKAGNVCVYCGKKVKKFHFDHLIPASKLGIDHPYNSVIACSKCNLSKGNKDIFMWYGDRARIPALVKSKYLKLVYEFHKNMGTLERSDMNRDGKFDVMDLDIFHAMFDVKERGWGKKEGKS